MEDLKAWKGVKIVEEREETKRLARNIEQKVEKIGRDNAIEKIIKGLNVKKVKSEIEQQEIRARIAYYLDTLHEIHLLSTFEYGNDVARALALKLDVLKTLIINERNIMSYGDLRQYNPKKNGLNILKHGLSFDEVLSTKNNSFGTLLVRVFEDGDQREIVFTKASDKEKYIVSVVKFHSAEDTNEPYNSEPMIFISSWYFDIHNFDKTVTERIRFTGKNNVCDPKAAAKEMKDKALIILKEAWGIKIK